MASLNIWETIGIAYTVLAVCAFTIAVCRIAFLGIRTIERRYERGQREEMRDLGEANYVREAVK